MTLRLTLLGSKLEIIAFIHMLGHFASHNVTTFLSDILMYTTFIVTLYLFDPSVQPWLTTSHCRFSLNYFPCTRSQLFASVSLSDLILSMWHWQKESIIAAPRNNDHGWVAPFSSVCLWAKWSVNLDVRIFAKCVYTLFQHSTNNDD